MDKREFTRREGFKVQADQLLEWQSILKPKVFSALLEAVQEANSHLPSRDFGSDVPRGTTLHTWVCNYMIGHRNMPLS